MRPNRFDDTLEGETPGQDDLMIKPGTKQKVEQNKGDTIMSLPLVYIEVHTTMAVPSLKTELTQIKEAVNEVFDSGQHEVILTIKRFDS